MNYFKHAQALPQPQHAQCGETCPRAERLLKHNAFHRELEDLWPGLPDYRKHK